MESYEGHWLVKAQIKEAWVRTEYWEPNGRLVPSEETVPPYLTFLGSQRFAYVVSTPCQTEIKKQEDKEVINDCMHKQVRHTYSERRGLLLSVVLSGILCFFVGYALGRKRTR